MMSEKLVQEILQTIESVTATSKRPLGLHEPVFAGQEWDYVKECLDSGWVSSVGKYVDQFETKLAEFTGVKKAIAVVNGTAALHISLLLAGVDRDDEVLTPAMTFVATANAVAHTGAVPHFIDIEERTLGIDTDKLAAHLKEIAVVRGSECFNSKTGRRIKAVLPMHTFGHPVDMEPLLAVCDHFRLPLVEDAAESLGSYYKGKHTGNWGLVSAMSFNGNKIVTTGGGGAILTNNEELAKTAKHITTTAKLPHKWAFVHDRVGYNYRMPNINAALGVAQLEQLPLFLANKRNLAERYFAAFQSVSGVSFFKEQAFAKSNYWLNALLLDSVDMKLRDQVLAASHERGIMTRPAWTLMHRLTMYENNPRMDLSTAENIEARLINLPSSANLA